MSSTFRPLLPSDARLLHGVVDALDACWSNELKVDSGFCGCSEEETDSDEDGVPDCRDSCPTDAGVTYRGDCGCPSDEEPVLEGSACNDALICGDFTCDGAGICGNPIDQMPEEDCQLYTIRTTAYWVCSPPEGRSFDEAFAACNAIEGRYLAHLLLTETTQYVAHWAEDTVWLGASDANAEGEWFWLDDDGSDDTHFWTEGADGSATAGRYAGWAEGEPHGYVCASLFGSSITPGG